MGGRPVIRRAEYNVEEGRKAKACPEDTDTGGGGQV